MVYHRRPIRGERTGTRPQRKGDIAWRPCFYWLIAASLLAAYTGRSCWPGGFHWISYSLSWHIPLAEIPSWMDLVYPSYTTVTSTHDCNDNDMNTSLQLMHHYSLSPLNSNYIVALTLCLPEIRVWLLAMTSILLLFSIFVADGNITNIPIITVWLSPLGCYSWGARATHCW